MVALAAAVAITACGGDDDVDEPEASFPAEVTTSEFPTRQRLAQTSDLVLGVENVGDETIPELAFTIFTVAGDTPEADAGTADGSFSIREADPDLEDPNRPVWILESKFPMPVEQLDDPPPGLSGGLRAHTNTYGFGPLRPDETAEIVWRLTPVRPGTYTLNYRVEAGLEGRARAVTVDGGEITGEFVVTITDRPPRARVDDDGEVILEEDADDDARGGADDDQ